MELAIATKNSRHAKNRGETESKLIEAAAVVFSTYGYDGASVKQVAEESGVNVSLINRYFGGKEGLLMAMIERLIVRKQQATLGYPPQPDLHQEIFEYLKFRLLVDSENDQLTRILISKVAVDEAFRERIRNVFVSDTDPNLRERLSNLQKTRKVPADYDLDQLFIAISYFSFSANFLGHAIMGRSRAEMLQSFDDFARVLARGVDG